MTTFPITEGPFRPQYVVDYLKENPGWFSSRALWVFMLGNCSDKDKILSFHSFRTRVALAGREGLIDVRVRHENKDKPYGHVNEYRYLHNIDNWTDDM